MRRYPYFHVGVTEPRRTGPIVSPEPSSTIQRGPYYANLPCNNIFIPLSKRYALDPNCNPSDLVPIRNGRLRKEAAIALNELIFNASQNGVNLLPVSAFRDYNAQAGLFQSHVNNLGLTEAERQSARPGHSEHQLGTTVDVTSNSALERARLNGTSPLLEFIGTPEAKWLEENSWKYGFIVSYPKDKEHITGYMYEPWHIRYVTRPVAEMVQASGMTLLEFLLNNPQFWSR